MPLYEYRCDNCGQQFEVIQKFSDQPLTVHDVCGGKVERLVSAPAFHFKGSGWYVTDYAKNSSSQPSQSSPNNGGGDTEKSKKTEPDTKKSDSSTSSSDSSSPTPTPSSSSSGSSSGSSEKK